MINRTIKKEVLKSLKFKPITLITGARQVGKTTLCMEIMKESGFNYVSLDDFRLRKQAIDDPELFLAEHKWPLIIDEVQYAPRLFDVIESIVNKQQFETGNNAGMYILTGSQTYELMKGVTQSMAGRVSIIRMPPLSVREIHNFEDEKFSFDINEISGRTKNYKIEVDDLYKLIVRGMYPELYKSKDEDSTTFYSNYVSSYIERDVSTTINLKDKLKFQNFMEILASLTGEELVYDNIAKLVQVDSETIKNWLSILLAGDIIYLLRPYNEISVIKRIVRRPKIYFNDTGLACYLARITNDQILSHSFFKGRFVETYIVNELRKSYKNNGIVENFYYYRDKNQNEIDLVILDGGVLHLIECKSGYDYSKKDVKSFAKLSDSNYELGNSFVICNTSSIYTIDDKIYAIPISSI